MSSSDRTTSNVSPTGAILRGHDFCDTIEMLLELDQQLGIIPAPSRDSTVAAADRLRHKAADIGYVTTRQVIDNANALIAAVTGVKKAEVTQFHKPEQAQTLHLYRNILLASVLAGSRNTLENKADAEQLAKEVPSLRRRTASLTRPNSDDETLLLRTWALTLSEVGGPNGRRAACVYAQCDAGLYPGETTMVSRQNLDLTPGNGLIEAPGLDTGVTSRILTLDEFNIRVIATFMEQTNDAPAARLTYRPRTDIFKYQKAMVSAVGILDRQRAAVGLAHGDTTASSITMWRAVHTQLSAGVTAAVMVCGRRDEDSYLRFTRTRRNTQSTQGNVAKSKRPPQRC
jgi:hypothetical protein